MWVVKQDELEQRQRQAPRRRPWQQMRLQAACWLLGRTLWAAGRLDPPQSHRVTAATQRPSSPAGARVAGRTCEHPPPRVPPGQQQRSHQPQRRRTAGCAVAAAALPEQVWNAGACCPNSGWRPQWLPQCLRYVTAAHTQTRVPTAVPRRQRLQPRRAGPMLLVRRRMSMQWAARTDALARDSAAGALWLQAGCLWPGLQVPLLWLGLGLWLWPVLCQWPLRRPGLMPAESSSLTVQPPWRGAAAAEATHSALARRQSCVRARLRP